MASSVFRLSKLASLSSLLILSSTHCSLHRCRTWATQRGHDWGHSGSSPSHGHLGDVQNFDTSTRATRNDPDRPVLRVYKLMALKMEFSYPRPQILVFLVTCSPLEATLLPGCRCSDANPERPNVPTLFLGDPEADGLCPGGRIGSGCSRVEGSKASPVR